MKTQFWEFQESAKMNETEQQKRTLKRKIEVEEEESQLFEFVGLQ